MNMTVRELISVLSNQDQGAEVVGYDGLAISCFPKNVFKSCLLPYKCSECGNVRNDLSMDRTMIAIPAVCPLCRRKTTHVLNQD